MNKQYILVVDDVNMALMSKVIAGLKFVEIQAMTIDDNPKYQLLVTPVQEQIQEPVSDD